MKAKIIALVLTTIFISACSVEDPYETGPTESQQAEQEEQDKQESQTAQWQITIADTNGNAVNSASIVVAGVSYLSDNNGRVSLPSFKPGNYSISVTKAGFEPLLITQQLLSSDQQLTLQLKTKPTDAITLFFAGDTMFGRRYMDPSLVTMGNSLPDVEGALIRAQTAAQDAVAITKYIKPLVEQADFSSVNLETPILSTPISVHPTKEFAFFSLPETLQGLTEIGVDYVALGNNHVYDYLQPGLEDTVEYVSQAGLLFSGVGNNSTEAFAPLITSVKGMSLGLVSATSITGDDNPINYVAEVQKGGAADLTDSSQAVAAVEQAIEKSDFAIAQLHGGDEYSYAPTRYITNRFNLLSEVQPDLLIAHHPHVAQGFSLLNNTPVLLGLGNFVFEQNRIETLLGVAVTLEVSPQAQPKTTRARAYAIYLEDYQPKLVTGFLSDYLMRRLGEFSQGGVSVVPRQGYADIDFYNSVAPKPSETAQITLEPGLHTVDLREFVPSKAFLTKVSSSGSVTLKLGRDLMLFGDFEDWDNDDTFGEVSRWENDSENITPCLTGARNGKQGMCMVRTQFDNRPLRMPFKHTIRTMPITPSETTIEAYHDMTLIGYNKGLNAGALDAELSITTSEDNLLFSEQTIRISEPGEYNWQMFEHSFSLPSDNNTLGPEQLPARAVKLAFLHTPPQNGEATLILDDLALISWQKDLLLDNNIWQANEIHGLDFLRVSTQQEVTLSLEFSTLD
ncbi:CapA family protein [Pseudoalteromonas sp. Of7M-16]|uniref:CapA family protein n=1 Tax=Pseudoalteromonas sp. Of7M-16 TaxID=2917756 RepID=UPI001EF3F5A3|nr:CapA family protein [Pseudoalteromonas sp. Of7M-16]MCG7548865.1 CapA family protein [Pseudoalteromonas sp. Of7M-16]